MSGVRVLLNYRNCRSFAQFLGEMNNAVHPTTGFARKAFDAISGRQITTLQDLMDGQNIVVIGGNEQFKRMAYSITSAAPIMSPSMIRAKREEIPMDISVFPNGDAYHRGITIPVTTSKFPDFSKVMKKLTLCFSTHAHYLCIGITLCQQF